MSTSDAYQIYIQHNIINPINQLLGGYVQPSGQLDLFGQCTTYEGSVPKDSQYENTLHEMMIPYYQMYLFGDTQLCKPNMESIRWEMKRIIEQDSLFGQWASKQDLMVSAECWGDNMKRIDEEKRINQYFYILQLLHQSECTQDWKNLSQELKTALFQSEVYSDYKTDEVLCVLHAFTMIMQQDWSKEKKGENLELLRCQWKFMKYYYSIMIRHIVGVKWRSFIDVSNTVMNASQSFLPHLHIYYCGLMDFADEMYLDRRKRRKLEGIIKDMQDVVNRTEPSEMLYELCDALFPEDFQRMLREHRPKTYKEVEDESRRKDVLIKQLGEQKGHLQNELDRTREVLQKMIEAAIPIDEVDAELMKYPPSVAWELLRELNNNPVLTCIEVWHNAYPSLLSKYRDRLNDSLNQQKELTEAIKSVAERPTNSYNYAAGATHDDKRQQLLLGKEGPKSLQ